MSTRPGLFAINRSGASGKTEVHVLIGQENFSNFSIHTATGLHPTNQQWSFTTCDLDRDMRTDLVAINRSGASGATEVHVLSGRSNFQQFILQSATGLHPTGSEWNFALADWNGDGRLDLIAINRQGASGKTEVHVLSGSSGFQEFIAHIATGLHATDAGWDFLVADWTGNGQQDLIAINRNGSSRTEIHVLSAASGLQNFIAQSATGLHPTGPEWRFGVADWDNDGKLDLVGINPTGASGTTEVHILSAASVFEDFVLHATTGLHHTDPAWELLVPDSFLHLQAREIFDFVLPDPTITPRHRDEFLLAAYRSSGSSAYEYYPMHLNPKERAFVKEHPIDAARGYMAARDAIERAERDFPDSLQDGKGDAVRHCYWSGRLHRDMSPERADEILSNHEFGRNDPHDHHNNSVGKSIGASARDHGTDDNGVWEKCKGSADSGGLKFNE